MTRLVAALAHLILLMALGVLAAPASHAASRQAKQPSTAPVALPAVRSPLTPDQPAPPQPGRVRTYGDWSLGCDNVLSCTAISLLPESAAEPYPVLMTFHHDAGPAGSAVLRLSAFDQLRGKVELRVDGNPVASLTAARDSAELSGPAALRAIRALGAGYSMELRQKKTVIGRISLNGLRDALIAIDNQQGRSGTVSALAAVGNGPAARVRVRPDAPEVPVSAIVAGPAAPEAVLSPREIDDARKLAVCDGRLDTSYPVEVHHLGEKQALVLLPCNAAAYNVSVVPLLAQGEPGNRTLAVARFDHVPGFTGDPGTPTLLVNPRWNPRLGRLSSFAKGRGLGDCGTAEDYVWDGAMFRLVEARAMPMCRGAWEWPRIWFAEAKRK